MRNIMKDVDLEAGIKFYVFNERIGSRFLCSSQGARSFYVVKHRDEPHLNPSFIYKARSSFVYTPVPLFDVTNTWCAKKYNTQLRYRNRYQFKS